MEQVDIVAGTFNVKHEAASGHDFLDRLGLIINKSNDDPINPSILGLGDRSVEKLIKVIIFIFCILNFLFVMTASLRRGHFIIFCILNFLFIMTAS